MASNHHRGVIMRQKTKETPTTSILDKINRWSIKEETTSEKPAWMKNLKNRKSEKRPESMISLATNNLPGGNNGDADEPPKPSWLTNLKKRKEIVKIPKQKSPFIKKEDVVKISGLVKKSRFSGSIGSTRKTSPAVSISGKPKPPQITQKPVTIGKTPPTKTLEEVSGELKSLKDLVTKMQLEFENTTQRLSSELQTGKRERISLQVKLEKLKEN